MKKRMADKSGNVFLSNSIKQNLRIIVDDYRKRISKNDLLCDPQVNKTFDSASPRKTKVLRNMTIICNIKAQPTIDARSKMNDFEYKEFIRLFKAKMRNNPELITLRKPRPKEMTNATKFPFMKRKKTIAATTPRAAQQARIKKMKLAKRHTTNYGLKQGIGLLTA